MSASATRVEDFGPYLRFELRIGDLTGTLYTCAEDVETEIRLAFYAMAGEPVGVKH